MHVFQVQITEEEEDDDDDVEKEEEEGAKKKKEEEERTALVSDDADDYVDGMSFGAINRNRRCQYGSLWMVVLDELMGLELDSYKLGRVIAELESEPWAAGFLDMKETDWSGEYEKIENPFEREEYAEFYNWFLKKKAQNPRHTDRQMGGIRIKFPDMSLWSLVCLGASAITGKNNCAGPT